MLLLPYCPQPYPSSSYGGHNFPIFVGQRLQPWSCGGTKAQLDINVLDHRFCPPVDTSYCQNSTNLHPVRQQSLQVQETSLHGDSAASAGTVPTPIIPSTSATLTASIGSVETPRLLPLDEKDWSKVKITVTAALISPSVTTPVNTVKMRHQFHFSATHFRIRRHSMVRNKRHRRVPQPPFNLRNNGEFVKYYVGQKVRQVVKAQKYDQCNGKAKNRNNTIASDQEICKGPIDPYGSKKKAGVTIAGGGFPATTSGKKCHRLEVYADVSQPPPVLLIPHWSYKRAYFVQWLLDSIATCAAVTSNEVKITVDQPITLAQNALSPATQTIYAELTCGNGLGDYQATLCLGEQWFARRSLGFHFGNQSGYTICVSPPILRQAPLSPYYFSSSATVGKCSNISDPIEGEKFPVE